MGCGASASAQPKKVSTTFVQVVPASSPPVSVVPEPLPEDDSDLEDGPIGREMSDMMMESAPSDHIYLKQKETALQPIWMKRIAREWRILSRGLPEAIHLHLYEDRMDLMRAAIVGPKNTPYADALLFFDLYLPHNYPLVPPTVMFWAHGKRLNPNLYASGRICLSLLGTWSGTGVENWQPTKSNILQVLISILGLILVEDPYFNEPGFETSKGKPEAEVLSRKYSEDVRLNILKTMLIGPPKGFEELAKSHFLEHGAAIAKRSDRLAFGKPEVRAQGRIDGIEFRKGLPSDSFKKDLEAVLTSLKTVFPKTADAKVDLADDGDIPAEPLSVALVDKNAKNSKLAWMTRIASTMGGC